VWLTPAGGQQLFLLCSDGLTKELSDDRISELLGDTTPGSIASRLVNAAVAAGGHDNVTVVVVQSEWEEVNASESEAEPTMPAFLEETAPRK
jgi:serine/threonine protein phosphatase PrpC